MFLEPTKKHSSWTKSLRETTVIFKAPDFTLFISPKQIILFTLIIVKFSLKSSAVINIYFHHRVVGMIVKALGDGETCLNTNKGITR
jgi:hypothetical protein